MLKIMTYFHAWITTYIMKIKTEETVAEQTSAKQQRAKKMARMIAYLNINEADQNVMIYFYSLSY